MGLGHMTYGYGLQADDGTNFYLGGQLQFESRDGFSRASVYRNIKKGDRDGDKSNGGR